MTIVSNFGVYTSFGRRLLHDYIMHVPTHRHFSKLFFFFFDSSGEETSKHVKGKTQNYHTWIPFENVSNQFCRK